MENRVKFFDENGYWIEKQAISFDQMEEIFLLFYDLCYSTALRYRLSIVNKASTPSPDKVSYPNDMKILDELLLSVFIYSKDLIGEIYDTVSYSSTFFRLLSQKNIESISKELLGISPHVSLYGWTNRIRIDPPNDERRTYGWHQEIFYTIPETKFVQTWCPILRDTTTENGTIHICPKSHKRGIANQTWNEIEGKALQVIVDREIVDQYDQIELPMSIGDVLFFDGHLFHKSGHNTTKDEVRFSLVGMWNDTSSRDFSAPKPNFILRGKTAKDYFESRFSSGVIETP
jgi:hypothetical protein